MSIEISGLEDIEVKLDSLAQHIGLENNLKKACALVERSAKQKAPKGNGELRRSITSKVDDTKGVIFTPLEYAPYVEYGPGLFAEEEGRQDVPWHYQDDEGNWHSTNGMKPHPFLRPAWEENRGEIKRLLKGGKKKK